MFSCFHLAVCTVHEGSEWREDENQKKSSAEKHDTQEVERLKRKNDILCVVVFLIRLFS